MDCNNILDFLAAYDAAELADLITTIKVEVIGGKGQKPNLISTELRRAGTAGPL